MIPTSVHAALFYKSTRIGKARNIQFQTSRDALENTPLNVWDRTFISGLRNSTASASLFYDAEDTATTDLLTDLYEDNSNTYAMSMIFDSPRGRSVSADVVLTSASLSSSFGAAQVCEIQFQISGKPTPVLG